MYTDVRISDNSSHPRILQAKKDKPEPAPVVAKVGYSHPSGVSVAREKALMVVPRPLCTVGQRTAHQCLLSGVGSKASCLFLC